MAQNKRLYVIAGAAILLTVLVVLILFLVSRQVISFEMARLMFVALLGLYVGFGVLIAVYRLVCTLK